MPARFRTILTRAALGGAALIALGACATDRYGYGGYYGDGYYGDGYYGNGYAGGYGQPYYGWYNDYYYPGTGVYVYGRDGRSRRWSNADRRYWEQRRPSGRGYRDNWDGYRGYGDGRFDRDDRAVYGRADRDDRYDRGDRYDRDGRYDRGRGNGRGYGRRGRYRGPN